MNVNVRMDMSKMDKSAKVYSMSKSKSIEFEKYHHYHYYRKLEIFHSGKILKLEIKIDKEL